MPIIRAIKMSAIHIRVMIIPKPPVFITTLIMIPPISKASIAKDWDSIYIADHYG
jgi:hypothetical protein